VHARAGCTRCAAIVLDECRYYAEREIANGDPGLDRGTMDEIVDAFIEKVEAEVLEVSGSYNPVRPLWPYVYRLFNSCWCDFWRKYWRELFAAVRSDLLADVVERSPAAVMLTEKWLRAQELTDDEICVIQRFYGCGQSAKQVAEALGGDEHLVNVTRVRFRKLVATSSSAQMQRAGFEDDEIKLVSDFRLEFYPKLRSDHSKLRSGSNRRSASKAAGKSSTSGRHLPKICQRLKTLAGNGDINSLLAGFEALLQSPKWDHAEELQQFRRELRKSLRDDVDWIPFELHSAEIGPEAIDVYLGFWKGSTPETIRKKVSLAPGFANVWLQVAALLEEVKSYDEEFCQHLSKVVHDWYEKTTRRRLL
jgi:hypothetical protein